MVLNADWAVYGSLMYTASGRGETPPCGGALISVRAMPDLTASPLLTPAITRPARHDCCRKTGNFPIC